MNTRILITVAVAALAQAATAAPDFIEWHQRVHEHVFKGIKAVRDVLVPKPARDFVEGFPPVAIPRATILQLAQAPPGFAQARAGAPAPREEQGVVALQQNDAAAAAALGIDAEAIADWANNFAALTTERTLDAVFPKAALRQPIIVGGERDAKANATLQEDLNVMMRILEKAAGARDDGKATAMGIDVLSFGKSSGPRVFYIDGYGAMFVLNVRYPLLAPPKKDDQNQTNDATNTEWERAREEVYGQRRIVEEFKFTAAGGEFDAQRVENLKQQITDDLAHAKHIRGLKPDDYVSVVVLGGGAVKAVTRRVESRPGVGRGGGGGGAVAVFNSASGEGGAQTTMTLRAKKSDIDAFAKGTLNGEEFRKKVAVQVY